MTTQRRLVFTGLIFGSCVFLSSASAAKSSPRSLTTSPSCQSCFDIFDPLETRIVPLLAGSHHYPSIDGVGRAHERSSSGHMFPSSHGNHHPRPYHAADPDELHSGLSPP